MLRTAATAGEAAAEDAGTVAKASAKATAKAAEAAKAVSTAARTEGQAVAKTTSTVTQMLESLAKRVTADNAKMLFFFQQLMQLLETVGVQSFEIASSAQEIELTKARKHITMDLAHGKALLEELKSLMPGFDVTLDALQSDSQSMVEFVAGLMQLFKSFVDSASEITTALHQAG